MTNKTKIKLVIDTDIGTDCDDLFALAYALKNKNADVRAITTVHGNTIIRAKIARKLERILGVNIPIIAGESCSPEMVKRYWTGIEEKALTAEEIKENFKSHAFPVYDKDTKLVCIGPLTNIAKQIRESPTISNVKEIYIMGSNDESHNFKADLEAVKLVYAQKWKVYQITKEVCQKITLTPEEIETFKGTELGNLLYESAKRWLQLTGRKESIMYDLLAVSAALNEGYVKFFGNFKSLVSDYVSPMLKNKLMETLK